MDNEANELLLKQQQLIKKPIFHKVYPACCTDQTQVFENRKEYDELANIHFKIDKIIEK